MKNTIYKDLIPLYKMGAEYLLALRVDISTGKKLIDDCLVLQTNTNGTFSDKPWSLQKHMKFNGAYYDPIPIKSWTETQRKIFKNFTPETINKIEQLLLDPPQESVKSLIFIPLRLLDKTIKPESLIKDYIENYNEYLDSTIEYPDEADDDFYAFLESEKLILEYFGLRQEKKLNQFLYYFVVNGK